MVLGSADALAGPVKFASAASSGPRSTHSQPPEAWFNHWDAGWAEESGSRSATDWRHNLSLRGITHIPAKGDDLPPDCV